MKIHLKGCLSAINTLSQFGCVTPENLFGEFDQPKFLAVVRDLKDMGIIDLEVEYHEGVVTQAVSNGWETDWSYFSENQFTDEDSIRIYNELEGGLSIEGGMVELNLLVSALKSFIN